MKAKTESKITNTNESKTNGNTQKIYERERMKGLGDLVAETDAHSGCILSKNETVQVHNSVRIGTDQHAN